MSRDAFGPNLRRIRLQRGITLQHISSSTKIPVELLAGLESNNFDAWPAGIYARAYIRQYAYAIGVDPDSTVDEFCRWFPQGDRRVRKLVREHAEIVGHDSEWRDELPAKVTPIDRRGVVIKPPAVTSSPTHSAIGDFFLRLRRTFGRA
jgi:transcriptional regulator with XRE-family HTH domain